MSKFKKGDRVRLLVDRGDLKLVAGDIGVLREDDDGAPFVDWERIGDYWAVDSRDLEHVAVAASNSNELRIEAGKFYKTRDGRKALVGNNERDETYPFYHEVDGRLWHGVTREGKSCIGDLNCDLIAEWVDEPAAEQPAVAVAASAGNDNAEPKFKVGDRVRAIDGTSLLIKGDVYVVKKVGGDEVFVDVKNGNEVLTLNYSASDYFELDAPASSNHAIVALIENGQPLPSHRPHVHATKDAATKEASRLAKRHPGKQFGVYELVATKKEAVVYSHEWQRLAAGGRKIDAIRELRSATGLYLKGAKDAVEGWLAHEAA